MTRECDAAGCNKPKRSRGYCHTHYKRLMKGLDMDTPIKTYGIPEPLFWQKVEKSDGCWLWTGSDDGKGYGKFRIAGKSYRAHRVSYEWTFGKIPDGREVDHVCRVRNCVNPSHLRLVTRAENLQNIGASALSSTGVRGVHWNKQHRAWVANVSSAGERTHLGYFSTVEEASAVVVAWRREHMPYSEMDKKKENA